MMTRMDRFAGRGSLVACLLGCAACMTACALPVPMVPRAAQTDAAAASSARHIAERRYTVFGIDRSGSYAAPSKALQLGAILVSQASPGDTLLFRWISESSYRTCELFERVTIPSVEFADDSNPFDENARRRRVATMAALDAFRKEAAERVAKATFEAAPRTDLFGFVAAATDAFSEAPAGVTRYLYLATDLQDNVRRRVHCDLTGVHVIIIAFQTGDDPNATAALRARWRTFFNKAHAASIEIRTTEALP